jgi:tetratricopeptide (TPR) repeat protein
VLDDEVVITRNQFVQKGVGAIPDIFTHDSFAGFERFEPDTKLLSGGRYRPLSLSVFAVIVSLGGNDPLLFHLLNILMFAVCGIFLYILLLRMLQGQVHREWIAWVSTAVFIVHPIHTEVVANIKSSDELLAFLFGTGSLWMLLKAVDTRNNLWLLSASVSFLLACFSKEHVLMLIPVVPLMLMFFRKAHIQRSVFFSLPLVASGILFLLTRWMVIGDFAEGSGINDPLNNPFLSWNGNAWESVPFIDRIATVFDNFLRYVKLLIIPYPLTHDYYPFHITVQNFSNPSVWLGLLAFGAMGYYGIKNFNRNEISAFGILFFLLTILITSNLFFPVGVFMAERFLFLPSAGFTLVAGAWSARKIDQHHSFIVGAVVILLLGLSVLTILRNQSWKDNETLFRADLSTSSKSVKLRYSLGTALLTKALQEPDTLIRNTLLEEAVTHLQFAVEHHPTYYDAWLALGAASYYTGRHDGSVKAYRSAFHLSGDQQSRLGLMYALQGQGMDAGSRGETENAITLLEEAWKLLPDTTAAIGLVKLYDQTGRKELAEYWKAKVDSLRLTPE